MVEPSDRDMMAAASLYRQEARAKELKEANKNEEETERDTDMSVSEALEQISVTFESDKFFADLATPLFACRNILESGEADAQSKAAAELGTLVDQISRMAELKLFLNEQKVLEDIIKGLVSSDPLTLSTVLTGVRSTKTPQSTRALSEEDKKRIKEAMDKHNKKIPSADEIAASIEKEKKAQAKETLWNFEEFKNQPEFRVTIKVPAETKTSHCKVKFKADVLCVSIDGHASQPYVINGKLLEKVDPDACSWTLDGSGDGRKLVLEMEKKMGGFMWNRLMKPEDVFA
eukprot:gnl/MRDRNA2_/MRDRNA2_32745_c0_seq1.p1 gnl/MRDRNA2_/MRDRNA2_32745_c0~~gnl/MRDRNA2_/MRDRNA2_32745_c0_seq1.p1  ORF type:complete len:288 (+),score=73.38 gnl/MRDRNA2_/MRDRNA2_32745_c0_seq1:110-973(+)